MESKAEGRNNANLVNLITFQDIAKSMHKSQVTKLEYVIDVDEIICGYLHNTTVTLTIRKTSV